MWALKLIAADRFHYQGSLEILWQILEDYRYTGNTTTRDRYLIPLATHILGFYAGRFGRDATGKVHVFPTNSLETWQCPDPSNPSSCPSNDMPTVAGLHAVLALLVDMPGVPPAAMVAWRQLQSQLPDLPVGRWAGGSEPQLLPARTTASRKYPTEFGGSHGHDMSPTLPMVMTRYFPEPAHYRCRDQSPTPPTSNSSPNPAYVMP